MFHFVLKFLMRACILQDWDDDFVTNFCEVLLNYRPKEFPALLLLLFWDGATPLTRP